MTLKQIADRVESFIRDSSTTTDAVVRDIANDVASAILLHSGFRGQESIGTIHTVANRSTYALEPDVARILEDMWTIENQTIIHRQSAEDWSLRPKPTATGTPSIYNLWGQGPVYQQPESKVHLGSTSASDTQNITLYGMSGGRPISETVTLTGTTDLLSTRTFQYLTDEPVLASVAVGTITGTMNASSGDATLPIVGTPGDVTVFKIDPTFIKPSSNTTSSTTVTDGASHVRIKMTGVDTVNDQSKSVTIEGYGPDTTNSINRLQFNEVETTGSDSTVLQVSTSKFTEITNIIKDWNSTNSLVVSVDPQKVVAVIGPETRSLAYPYVQFYPEPTGQAIQYRYMAKWRKLFNDSDQPVFDDRFDTIWLAHTQRFAKDYKKNEPPISIISDPALEADVMKIASAQRITEQSDVIMGGNTESRRQSFGVLDPSRFSNDDGW